jgi:hypothetical protein
VKCVELVTDESQKPGKTQLCDNNGAMSSALLLLLLLLLFVAGENEFLRPSDLFSEKTCSNCTPYLLLV